METLEGTVGRITFRNDDTGFTVLRLTTDNACERVCVGCMPNLEPGETVVVRGSGEQHPTYGPRFNVSSYEIRRPTTREGIERLLGSGFVPHIGPARAAQILQIFGVAALDILDNDPRRLLEVPGIGKKTLASITESWSRQREVRTLIMWLGEFGVSIAMAHRIYRRYGSKARETISANPYLLVEDVWGIGFMRADALARNLGFEPHSYKRIRAGLVHLLQEAGGEGHCFLPGDELVERGAQLLEVSAQEVQYTLDHAAQAGPLAMDQGRVYLGGYYRAEVECAAMIRERCAFGREESLPNELLPWLDAFARTNGWDPDPLQRRGVVTAVSSRIFLLTGGPGTGKTTTLHAIVSWFRSRHQTVTLAAPTGRAAQRMGTVAGIEAGTMHRLLEYRPCDKGMVFNRNRDNPLDTTLLVLDEVSMVDIVLMRHLLCALPLSARLILVGDSNQLPSVGPGNVLADLIASGTIPHVELRTVFRQAARSRIVTCAHEIISGNVPTLSNDAREDCFFLVEEEPARCAAAIVDLVSRRLPEKFGLDPFRDIQTLTPMHRGELGTVELNALLQKRLNPDAAALVRGERRFAVGDRVMQLRNNYDRGVFNGDIGVIAGVSDQGTLQVDFDTVRGVAYQARELDDLVHAYCISIHKSQGCEFKAVVVAVHTSHFVMLQRNLLYTALTRARQLCVFAGTPRAFSLAVRNDKALRRNSALSHRIRE